MSILVVLMTTFQIRARHEIKQHRLHAFCMYFSVSTLMVYMRIIFRLIETAEGLGGEPSAHEVYFAYLEFAQIILVVLLFCIWHPGRCLGAKVRAQDKKLAVISNFK